MEFDKLGSLTPSFAILRDGNIDCSHQVFLAKWFRQEVDRSGLHCTH